MVWIVADMLKLGETTHRFLKHVSTESSVIFSLNYKVQSCIYSVRKILMTIRTKGNMTM